MVGNDVIFATSATLGGHCEIGDFVSHRRAVRRAPVHPDRAAGNGGRGVRRARRHHSVRPRQRPVCGARRPQHHRHEAPQVHQGSGWRECAAFYQKLLPRPRHLRRAAGRGAGARAARIRRSPKSSASSARASTARCACPPGSTEQALITGMAASHDLSGLGDFFAGRRRRRRRRHAVCGGGVA